MSDQLNKAQITTLHDFVFASIDPALVDARTRGDTTKLMDELNKLASGPIAAWRTNVPPTDSDEAPNYSQFDAIDPGKRESWGFFLNFNRDFTRQKVRGWITSVWGTASAGSNAQKILEAGLELATVAQNVIGGTTKVTDTVSAMDRNYWGRVSQTDAQAILKTPE